MELTVIAKILVVANPANTNCLMLSTYASKIPKKNFSCLTRLDHNRAQGLLARKAGTTVDKVKNVIIWGNHSGTQYPDVTYATVNGQPAPQVVTDRAFLEGEFITTIQKRGAAIIAARKASSALSAARAIRDHMHSWMFGTAPGDFISMGVLTPGNKYGIDENLCFSFPCKCKDFDYEIAEGLAWNEFSRKKIEATQKELQDERKEAMGH